jgi:Tol biopolymer transport system component
LRENALEADYGPDGQLAVVTQDTEGGQYRLEYPMGKILYETSGWISNPRVSPSGDRVAFLEHPAPSDDMGTVMVVDRAGKSKEISPRWPGTKGLAWTPRGDEVWFSAARTGPAYVIRAADMRGRIRDVLTGAGGLLLQDISRDGRLLITRSAARSEIHALIDGSPKERDLSWLDNTVPTDLSRNGQLLLFAEGSPAIGSLYATCMRKTDGSPVTRLGDGFSTAFSPDSKWTVSFIPTSPGQMVLLPIGAGQSRTLDRASLESYGYTAGWFPDSRRILFSAHETGKPLRPYVQDISGGPPRPILKEGIVLPRPVVISPDGSQVPCQSAEHKWMLCSLTSDATKPLPGLGVAEQAAQWTPDGKSLYVFDPHEMPLQLMKLDVATGKRTPWKDLAPSDMSGVHGSIFLAITPDGRSVAYSTGREFSELFAVDGVK